GPDPAPRPCPGRAPRRGAIGGGDWRGGPRQWTVPDGRHRRGRHMTAAVFVAAMLVLFVMAAGALYRQWRLNENLRAQLEAASADLEHLQQACSRLAPAGVVQRLVADGAKPGTEPAAERKVVTALFADLVGYTALSERLEPAILARVL